MSLTFELNPAIKKLPVYLPGKPIEEVARELGLAPESICKLASNESPLGPSPKAIEAMKNALNTVNLYPDGNAFYLKEKLSKKLNLPSEYIIVGNGSNELLELIAHAMLQPCDECIMSQYSFAVYPIVTKLSSAEIVMTPAKNYGNDLDAMLKAITSKTRIIFIANPNNPTGTHLSEKELKNFIEKVPQNILIVIDEAYTEYQTTPPDLVPLIRNNEKNNLVICRTFSKIYGLAGIRIGFAMASPEFIQALNKVREPFNSNQLAQVGAMAALDDTEFLDYARNVNLSGLEYLQKEFDKMGLEYIPSVANFILVKVGNGIEVFQSMEKKGIIIRPVNNYNLPEWIRITVGTEEQNIKVIKGLKEILGKKKYLTNLFSKSEFHRH